MTTSKIIINARREKPIQQQHPWIFSRAIAEAHNASPGDVVSVYSDKGDFLARGYWNPKSQIQVRILTWQDEPIDDAWWRKMLQRAIQNRKAYWQGSMSAYRLVNAENDFIPGLVVDRYGDYLVLQALTLYIDQQKQQIAQYLSDLLAELGIPVLGIYERSDVDVRRKEGLEMAQGVLIGEAPPPLIEIQQGGYTRLIDVYKGHKTGYYLDQISNQDWLNGFVQAQGLNTPEHRLLNICSYTGGFGLGAGLSVVNVDTSHPVLSLAEETYTRNNIPADQSEFVQADAFDYLHDFAAGGPQFDMVICDPPKFAHSRQQIERAARGYKDLNLNAFKVIREGGYLMTFSCSGAIDADLFQKIVFGALADSGRQAQIIQHLGPGNDHPVALTFPEGAYLKGLLLRVF